MLNTILNGDDLDEHVQIGLNKLNATFRECEQLINDHLLGDQFDTAVQATNGMEPAAKAKYYATIAFVMQTLYNVHLRLCNEETRIESSEIELERVKQTILKIKNAIHQKPEHESNGNGNAPRMRLDKAAAKRFVAHNLDKDAQDKMYAKFGDEMRHNPQ